MHIVFLGSAESWYLRDLQRAAGHRHMVVPAPFSNIESAVGGGEISVFSGFRSQVSASSLSAADCVLVRTMPPGTLEQVVFRMDALASIEAAGTLVINPPKAIEAAVDKYLTTSRLARAGLLVPRTHVCQTADAAMQAFGELGGDVVLKPLFGGEGRGITRIADESFALRAFKLVEQLGGVIYLQEFIEHEGYDIRVMLVGDKPLAMRRRNQLDWRTNVSRGARAEAYQATENELQMAHLAAQAVGAPLAGVDLLPARDGRLFAIEVNAVPGWRALGRATKVDVSGLVLQWLESLVD
ncbi:RimK family alpha-L-glutamate ligase [Aeoliella sp. ICT_H6.2]|uniref:RimK family alpha-L-glutamate ligase n=1 Tax=Aeoliella straminimaris TaxID=2954799 RepID=A0A9X2JG99_9BACT|nr:RimK family alpha-L-glutamate ligase [Aeoliella straminimaris]MCO6044860.1 RimK family alpha-L-glutamate ligase [Aeoliella straminimaris]